MMGVFWGLKWFWGGSKQKQIFGAPKRSFLCSQEVWGTPKRFLGSDELGGGCQANFLGSQEVPWGLKSFGFLP